MTKTQLNMELEDAELAVLERMAGKALKRQAVARMLLLAAIEAVEENGGMVSLPPKFYVVEKRGEAVYRLNDEKERKHRK